MNQVRLHVRILLVLLLLVPTILLGVRWADPSVGQLPFGWQMHTRCWGDPDHCA